MDELKRSMEMLEVAMDLEGEQKRIEAIIYCLRKGYTDHTIDALELMYETITKCRKIALKHSDLRRL